MTAKGCARPSLAALLTLCACRGEPPTLQPPAPELQQGSIALANLSPAELLLPASAPIQRERKAPKAKVEGVVNVNRASEAELRLLPGIGKTRAHAIVARRARRPFASLDEVARMPRMRSLVRQLRRQLTVSGETTLRPASVGLPAG